MQLMNRDAQPVESEITKQVAKWAVAAAIACAALLGAFALVAAVVILFELPPWADVVIGVGLALGACAFAWLVASALGSDRPPQRDRASVRRLDSSR